MTLTLPRRHIGTLCFHSRLTSPHSGASRFGSFPLGLAVRSATRLATKPPVRKTVKRDEPKALHEFTQEEQLAQVERMMTLSDRLTTVDIWGQMSDTLDVILPSSTSPSNRKNYSTWRAMLRQFKQNRLNDVKNFSSLWHLAKENAIPGIDLSEATRTQRYITQWPWRIFTTASIAKGSWMETLRREVVKAYTQLNSALARRDDKTLKALCTSAYKEHIMRLRKKQHPQYTYIWRPHKEVTPTQVLSLRATEGLLSAEDPKFGNRMLIQALVKIDMEQSLEIYDRQGNPLHVKPSSSDVKVTDADVGKHPAERRRVTEYLVFEKRMWYDGPWVVREQLWEYPEKDPIV